MAENPAAAINKGEDEDYMGDLSKFLSAEPCQPPKSKRNPPKTLETLPQSSKKKKKLLPNDQKQSERERKQLAEDEKTLENLKSAIPQSNIGFKLLKQMGYTPGTALGKEGSGRAEPVGLEIRRTRAGIGREDPVKERARREREKVERERGREERERRREEELVEEFGLRRRSEWRRKRVVANFHKARAVLDQLENREPIVEEEKSDNEEEEEEEEEQISEEDLLEVLIKLREEHCYCLFCGCKYESTEALLSDCPGIDEDDH